jgi:hypothetical protein
VIQKKSAISNQHSAFSIQHFLKSRAAARDQYSLLPTWGQRRSFHSGRPFRAENRSSIGDGGRAYGSLTPFGILENAECCVLTAECLSQASSCWMFSSMAMSLNSLASKTSPHSRHSTNSASSSRATTRTRGWRQSFSVEFFSGDGLGFGGFWLGFIFAPWRIQHAPAGELRVL